MEAAEEDGDKGLAVGEGEERGAGFYRIYENSGMFRCFLNCRGDVFLFN